MLKKVCSGAVGDKNVHQKDVDIFPDARKHKRINGGSRTFSFREIRAVIKEKLIKNSLIRKY